MMTSVLSSPLFQTWIKLLHLAHHFFFKEASARPLAIFRISLASLLLWQAYLIHENFLSFFSASGFVQGAVSTTLNDPSAPSLEWLTNFMSTLGMSENFALTCVGLTYVLTLLILLAGLFTRTSAFLAWLLHWSLLNTGYSGAYGADMYAHIFLFYLVLIPCGHALSLDCVLNRVSGAPSLQARFGLRLLQLHMCISYLASGVEKASGEQWWNGEVLWRALTTPNYSMGDFSWLAYVPFLPIVSGWIVMGIEAFYCVMVWHKKTRPLWIGLTCLLHLGIGLFLTLPVFGILMCIPTVALFAISAEEQKQIP